MLSLKDILKVGRLLDQTGEPRPGFLHDGTDNLEGQGKSVQTGAQLINTGSAEPEDGVETKSVKLSLEYEEDPKTGEVRVVQR